MAFITNITSGEQTVSGTGAVTGTADVSALGDNFTLKVRVRGLPAGDILKLAIEDTQNSSEFSDAIAVAMIDVEGGMPAEGVTYAFRNYDVPSMRYGAQYNELRVNAYALSAGTAKVYAWIE